MAKLYEINERISAMKKILIVESLSVVMIGVLQILEDIGFNESVVDTVSSFDGMMAMIESRAYELVIFGLKMDQAKQRKSLLEVVQKNAGVIFLVFAEMMEITIQKKMYREGVKGILDKMSTKKEISFAIKRVLDNEIYIDSASSVKLFFAKEDNKKGYPVLTDREKQIAELLVQGKNNSQICETLNIMPSTVSTFKQKIFNKLRIQNIKELIELEKSFV